MEFLKDLFSRQKRPPRPIPRLHAASYLGDLPVVHECLSAGADVNQCVEMDNKMRGSLSSVTPLFLAAQKNHTAIIKVLLEAGANPTIKVYCSFTKERCTPAQIAMFNAHLKTAQMLQKASSRYKRNQRSSANSSSTGASMSLQAGGANGIDAQLTSCPSSIATVSIHSGSHVLAGSPTMQSPQHSVQGEALQRSSGGDGDGDDSSSPAGMDLQPSMLSTELHNNSSAEQLVCSPFAAQPHTEDKPCMGQQGSGSVSSNSPSDSPKGQLKQPNLQQHPKRQLSVVEQLRLRRQKQKLVEERRQQQQQQECKDKQQQRLNQQQKHLQAQERRLELKEQRRQKEHQQHQRTRPATAAPLILLQPAVSRMSSLSSEDSLFGSRSAPANHSQRQQEHEAREGGEQASGNPAAAASMDPLSPMCKHTLYDQSVAAAESPAPVYLPLPPQQLMRLLNPHKMAMR